MKKINSPRRISLGMGGLKFLRALISIFTLMLSAKYFGTTISRDIWLLAIAVPSMVRGLFFGPANEIFRAKYVHIREEQGEKQAIASCSSLLSLFVFIAVSVIIFSVFFPQILAKIIAPGFVGDNLEVLSHMIQITIPLLLFDELVSILSSVLNSVGSFLLPDIYSLFSGILSIVVLVLLTPHIGIYSLAVSFYLTTLLLFFILIVYLKKKGISLQLKKPLLSEYKPFIIFALPFYMSYGIGIITSGLEKVLTSYLPEGGISVLDYSRKFADFPLSVYMSIIFSILTPVLARHVAQSKMDAFKQEFAGFLRMGLIIFLPVIIALVVCSHDIVSLFLVRGNFNVSWINTTEITIAIFGLSIIGILFYSISGQALVTLKKAKLYAFIGAATQLGPICLNLFFYKKYGIPFFAFSWGLSHLIFGITMFLLLPRDRKILKDVGKILLLYIVTGIIAYFINKVATISNISVISIGVTVGVSLLVMLICLFLLNIEEKVIVYKIVSKLRWSKSVTY